MADEELEKLVLRLEADISGLTGKLDQVVSAAEKTSKNVEGAFSGRMTAAIERAAIELEALKKGFEFVKEVTVDSYKEAQEYVLHIEKSAEITGVQTKAMSQLAYAAQQSEVDIGELTNAFKLMNRSLEESKDPSSKAAQALAEIHLTSADLIGLKPEDAFKRIADGIAGLGTQGQKTDVSMTLFGRTGANLLPLLSQGSEGIEEFAKKADKLGLSFDRLGAEKMKVAKEAMNDLNGALMGLKITFAEALAPYITMFAEKLADTIGDAEGLHSTIVNLVQDIGSGAGYAADAWQTLKIAFYAVKEAAAAIGMSFWESVNGVTKAILWSETLLDNFGNMMEDEFGLVGVAILYAYDVIKGGIVDAIVYIGDKLEENLRLAAEAARKLHLSIADDLDAAADSVSWSMDTMANNATDATKKAEDAMSMAAAKVSDDWDNIMPTEQDLDTGDLQKVADESVNIFENARADLDEVWNEPWPDEAVNNWVSNALDGLDKVYKKKQETDDANSGAPKEDPRTQQYQDYLNTKLAGINKERLAEDQAYNEDVARAKETFKQLGTDQATQDAVMEKMKAEHEARLVHINNNADDQQLNWDKTTWEQRLGYADSVLGSLSTLMDSHHRRQFEIGKAAAYAQAIVSTASGVAQTFEQFGWYALLGPAEAVAAAGAVQIAKIASTSFGGGGGAPSVGSVGATPPISQGQNVTGQTQRGQAVNINLVGQTHQTQTIRDMFGQINEALADGMQISSFQVNA